MPICDHLAARWTRCWRAVPKPSPPPRRSATPACASSRRRARRWLPQRLPGSAWNFGWPLAVRLCDVDGGVDGLGVEEGGEDGELAVALDSSVLGFGGEHAGGGPAKPHVGGVAVTG